MRLTFLGTGGSFGTPMIGCQCAVCRSKNPKDHRLRSSALVESDTTSAHRLRAGLQAAGTEHAFQEDRRRAAHAFAL